MNSDVYSKLDDARGIVTGLQDARDKATNTLSTTAHERKVGVSDLMTEVGRFMNQLDNVCSSMDDALDELERLGREITELEKDD